MRRDPSFDIDPATPGRSTHAGGRDPSGARQRTGHEPPEPGKSTRVLRELGEHHAGGPGVETGAPGVETGTPAVETGPPGVETGGPRGEIAENAARGLAGTAGALPHLDRLRRLFGRHELAGVRAYTGENSAAACAELDADAYAAGESVAFAGAPDLRTAAHEAAHVVQQRHGRAPSGGIGAVGDALEQEADRVADRVVAGDPVGPLLGPPARASGVRAVQFQRRGQAQGLTDDRLRRVVARLRAVPPHVGPGRQQDMLQAIVRLLSGLQPNEIGRLDATGQLTRPAMRLTLDIAVAGLHRGVHQHTFTVFVSGANPTGVLAQHAASGPNAGSIRMFEPNLTGVSDDEIAQTLIHEMVHALNNAVTMARQGLGNSPVAAPGAAPGTPGTPAPGQRPINIGDIRGFDTTLGNNSAVSTAIVALETSYLQVIDAVNLERNVRGVAPLPRVETASRWVNSTVNEMMAYVLAERGELAMYASRHSGPRVTLGFSPNVFETYVLEHWLDDDADRRALRVSPGHQTLQQTLSSPSMTAVFNAVTRWLDQAP